MKKRILSLLLVVTMIVSLLPATVFADNLGENPTIAQILATNPDFPTSADDTLPANAWVCHSDRTKVIFKDNGNLTIGSYDSGQFNEQQDFNCSTASVVTWYEDGLYYYCEPEGYGTVKFNMESNVLKSITFDSGNYEGDYLPVTIENILPKGFPTSADNGWENSDNEDVCVYKDDSNLTFYDTEVAVSLSSLLTRAERNQDNESFACTFEHVDAESNFTIQFNMAGEHGDELKNIVVSRCTYEVVEGTYAPSEETVSYTVIYDANGATSGTAPANQTKTSGDDLTLAANTGNLAKTDYTFTGWNTKADGSGKHYDAGANYSTDADVSLYAEWAPITIADILPEDFPVQHEAVPSNAWVNDKGVALVLTGNMLSLTSEKAGDEVLASDTTTAELTKTEDNYSYSKDGVTTVFVIDSDDKLVSVQVNGLTGDFNGTYTAPHVHSFSYAADNDKLIATCADSDSKCDLTDKKVSLTLTAEDAFYDGAPYDGASTNDETVKFAETTGKTVAIEYWTAGEGAKKLDSAPTNAGSYVAKVTVTFGDSQSASAEKAFTINPRIVVEHAKDGTWEYDSGQHWQPEYFEDEAAENAKSKEKWKTDEVLEGSTGFVDGEGFANDLVMTNASTITDVGTKANVIDQASDKTALTKDTNPNNYEISYLDGTLTVTASNALTVKATPYEGIYDGEPHNITYTVKIGDEVQQDATIYFRESGTTDWTPAADFESYKNAMAAKTVEVKAEMNNYQDATDSATVTINKATPYINNLPGPSDITYGQTLAYSTLFGGSAWVSETVKTPITVWFEWTTADTVPTVADSDTTEYDVTVTPLGDFETNFATTTCKVKLTVGPADYADVTKAASGSLGAASGSTVEITLPAIPEGAAYGTAAKTNAEDKYTLSSISGGKITATSTGIDAGTGSMTFTVPVTPDNNHNGYNITVTITPTFKEVVTITADTEGFTYGDSGKIGYKDVSVVDNLVDVNTLVSTYYLSDGTTKTNTENSGAASEGTVPANAGSYNVVLSVPEINEAYIGSTTVAFTVGKKAVTVTANSKTFYVGDSFENGAEKIGAVITGLLNEDSVSEYELGCEVPFDEAFKLTTVGTYPVVVTVAEDAAGTNYTVTGVNGTLTISSRPTSSGGSSTPTVTVRVSGDENSVKVSATVSGSTATVDKIKDADLAKVSDAEAVEIDLSGVGKNVDTAKIPTETVEKIAEKSSMTVKLPVATVEFDKAATEEIADQAKGSNIELVVDDIKEVSLNAVQKVSVKKLDTAIIIDAHLASNGSKLCTADNGGFGGGKAKVILPYEIKNNRKPENYSVFYVNEAGKLEKLNAVYDEELTAFVFEIEHFSVYTVAFEQFVDIDANAYYYDAVKWAAANGITDGVDATHFNPSGVTNRAQMVTFLWRAAGKPEPTISETPFTDLDPNGYYFKAVLWAYEKGITDGTTETTFEPDMNVSRAQVVTFLWRYAGKPVLDYWMQMTDVASGKYYTEAVRWALAEGITDGTSKTTFSPNDDCLRGQIVTFLYRDFAK